MRMTRWKKNATEFEVRLTKSRNRDGSLDQTCRIPGPIAEALGNPTSLKFTLDGDRILVTAGDK